MKVIKNIFCIVSKKKIIIRFTHHFYLENEITNMTKIFYILLMLIFRNSFFVNEKI